MSHNGFLADELLKGTSLSEDELRKVYNKKSVSKEARRKAGKALGYSELRIFLGKLVSRFRREHESVTTPN